MPKARLRESLHAIREELSTGTPISLSDRELLSQLHDDIEGLLAQPTEEVPHPAHGVVREDAATAVEQFQGSHPSLTQALGRLVDTLVSLGF
jgi:hypothetical protein